MNNVYRVGDETLSIPPTLLISAISVIPDVGRLVSMDLKEADNFVYIVGTTRKELGGSRYYRYLGLEGGSVPDCIFSTGSRAGARPLPRHHQGFAA